MQEFILKNLINIFLIIFFIYGFIKGFGEGFLKKVLSFGSLILTVIITKYLTPIVATSIKDITNIESTLTSIIYDSITKSNSYDKLNVEFFKSIIDTDSIGKSIKDGLCTNIANSIINLICGILVFIIVLILIRIILKLLDVIDYIPVVGQFNKMLGGFLGVIEVIFIIWIIFTILSVLENIPKFSTFINYINESFIAKILYDNNLIKGFLSNLFANFNLSNILKKK